MHLELQKDFCQFRDLPPSLVQDPRLNPFVQVLEARLQALMAGLGRNS